MQRVRIESQQHQVNDIPLYIKQRSHFPAERV
jgi:hypothetical protein